MRAGVLRLALIVSPRRYFRRAAVAVLLSETGRAEADRLVEATEDALTALPPVRKDWSFGVRLVLRYLRRSLAFHQVLTGAGFDDARTNRLVEDLGWEMFGPPSVLSYRLTLVVGHDLVRRVRAVDRLMWRTMFNKPFERVDRPGRADLSFDVVRCPFAHYFAWAGVPRFTTHAACQLDERLAELWGMQLLRTGTIAEGNDLCDFGFSEIPVQITG